MQFFYGEERKNGVETSSLCLSIYLLNSQRVPHSVFRPRPCTVLNQPHNKWRAKERTWRVYLHSHCLLPANGFSMKTANSESELVYFYRTSEKFYYAEVCDDFQDRDRMLRFPSFFDSRSSLQFLLKYLPEQSSMGLLPGILGLFSIDYQYIFRAPYVEKVSMLFSNQWASLFFFFSLMGKKWK